MLFTATQAMQNHQARSLNALQIYPTIGSPVTFTGAVTPDNPGGSVRVTLTRALPSPAAVHVATNR
jgi:hypothetical protein